MRVQSDRFGYIAGKIKVFERRNPRGINSREIAEHMVEDLVRNSGSKGEILHELSVLGAQSAFTSQYKQMNRAKFDGVSKSTATSMRDAGQNVYITDERIALDQARAKKIRHVKSAESHTMSAHKFGSYADFIEAQNCGDMQSALQGANLSFEDFASGIAL